MAVGWRWLQMVVGWGTLWVNCCGHFWQFPTIAAARPLLLPVETAGWTDGGVSSHCPRRWNTPPKKNTPNHKSIQAAEEKGKPFCHWYWKYFVKETREAGSNIIRLSVHWGPRIGPQICGQTSGNQKEAGIRSLPVLPFAFDYPFVIIGRLFAK